MRCRGKDDGTEQSRLLLWKKTRATKQEITSGYSLFKAKYCKD
jgi:hypothetical protein